MTDDSFVEDARQKLLWKAPGSDAGRFLTVFMDQNTKCNLRCRTCGFSDPRVAVLPGYHMPRWLFDKIAADVFPRAHNVCLSIASEPFMTRDFPERLEAIGAYGVPYGEFTTNGTLLTTRAIDAIVTSAVARVNVSIDGSTKALYEFARPGARFEQVVANWYALHAARGEKAAPRLRINHVLTPFNIDAFDHFLEFAEALGADELSVRTVSRMSNAEAQESRDPIFWAKVAEARKRMVAFCRRTAIVDSGYLRDRQGEIRVPLGGGEIMTCRYPWTVIGIHPNGDALPCYAWTREPAGSFTRQTFDDIWNGACYAEIRREFEEKKPGVDCLHCSIRKNGNDVDEDDFFYLHISKPAATS
jgi:MoaA/NifB/PqqE/SkfB family radical SAM enzyme